MTSPDDRLTVPERERPVDPDGLRQPVEGYRIGEGWTLGEVVGTGDRASLLVFLRHYG